MKLGVHGSSRCDFGVEPLWSVVDLVDFTLCLLLTRQALKNMAQARVTDFFSQRKNGIAGKRATKPRCNTAASVNGSSVTSAATRSRSSTSKNKEATAKKDAFICSSSVHKEFMRVIDEAVGVNTGESAVCYSPGDLPASPRTPKRTSTDAEFDLGAAVFAATPEHSTAKKRRHAEASGAAKAHIPGRPTRRTARKKLLLVRDAQQVNLLVSSCRETLLIVLTFTCCS